MNRIMRLLAISYVLSGASYACAQKAMLCNGYAELCNRRYNEVAYAATHNGHSHKESDVHNQDLPIKAQLEQGIRAIKAHVWYDQDSEGKPIPFVCHGVDKKFLYEFPKDKFMEQVPFIYKPFARACIEKVEPMKGVVHKAFEVAYGYDNAQGLIPFNHCILDPARRPLTALLSDVKNFLDKNRNEVVTLILEDHTQNLQKIADDLMQTHLIDYVHEQQGAQPWPKLGDMINCNKRLVVLLHGLPDLAYDEFPWMHYIWDYAWDTQWDFKTINDFKDVKYDAIPHRGKEAYAKKDSEPNKLFIVHHFITDLIGGNKASAKKANKKNVVRPRLERLARHAHHMPNIIQIDFFEHPNGDIFDMVNELNGVGVYAGKPLCTFERVS